MAEPDPKYHPKGSTYNHGGEEDTTIDKYHTRMANRQHEHFDEATETKYWAPCPPWIGINGYGLQEEKYTTPIPDPMTGRPVPRWHTDPMDGWKDNKGYDICELADFDPEGTMDPIQRTLDILEGNLLASHPAQPLKLEVLGTPTRLRWSNAEVAFERRKPDGAEANLIADNRFNQNLMPHMAGNVDAGFAEKIRAWQKDRERMVERGKRWDENLPEDWPFEETNARPRSRKGSWGSWFGFGSSEGDHEYDRYGNEISRPRTPGGSLGKLARGVGKLVRKISGQARRGSGAKTPTRGEGPKTPKEYGYHESWLVEDRKLREKYYAQRRTGTPPMGGAREPLPRTPAPVLATPYQHGYGHDGAAMYQHPHDSFHADEDRLRFSWEVSPENDRKPLPSIPQHATRPVDESLNQTRPNGTREVPPPIPRPRTLVPRTPLAQTPRDELFFDLGSWV